jgi:hypothetical protein
MPVNIGDDKIKTVLSLRYRRPAREILVDGLALDWDFESRSPDDGLDKLLDEGIEPFEVVPKPHPRALAKARRELANSPKLKHRRFTARCSAEMAYSTALFKLKLKPTVLQCRAMLALRMALPAAALEAEKEVLK